MTQAMKSETITKPANSVEANIRALADAAVGLVDKQAQLELDNVGLFAKTAEFVRQVLNDIEKVKAFVALMKKREIKMGADLKKVAGMELTETEKSKLGQSNMLLPMMRTIFHDKGGKLRSFENYAYPMVQLLKDETLVTIDGLTRAIKDAVHETSGGKKTRGIEALRALERESRGASNARSEPKAVAQAIPMIVTLMKGLATLPQEVAAQMTFSEEGFGLAVVRKATDGSADIVFSVDEITDLKDIIIKQGEKVGESFELDPRFKAVAMPIAALNSLVTEAA
ncbi:hypothetical protein [Shinella sumterensis]|uniref:hypothetical protein n=1 Tax=Shinella sumterensis TaxID=1967501 RepID=UPI003F87E160